MAQFALQASYSPNQHSFKCSSQLWQAWSRYQQVQNQDSWMELHNAIAQQRVGNRLGRIESRKRKRRPKSYPWLKKSRS